jgi:hypothetical protein
VITIPPVLAFSTLGAIGVAVLLIIIGVIIAVVMGLKGS